LKKIFAIAVLVLLLINVGGYQLLFQYFIYQSDNAITEQINYNRYKTTDLVEVKIPVYLNMQNWDDFKPIGGQVTVKGNVYNYAQLRITRDTLYLMCIPNHNKAGLIKANLTYGKQVNDMPVSKKPILPLIKKSISESEFIYAANKFNGLISIEKTKMRHSYVAQNVINIPVNVAGQPPDACNFPCS